MSFCFHAGKESVLLRHKDTFLTQQYRLFSGMEKSLYCCVRKVSLCAEMHLPLDFTKTL